MEIPPPDLHPRQCPGARSVLDPDLIGLCTGIARKVGGGDLNLIFAVWEERLAFVRACRRAPAILPCRRVQDARRSVAERIRDHVIAERLVAEPLAFLAQGV